MGKFCLIFKSLATAWQHFQDRPAAGLLSPRWRLRRLRKWGSRVMKGSESVIFEEIQAQSSVSPVSVQVAGDDGTDCPLHIHLLSAKSYWVCLHSHSPWSWVADFPASRQAVKWRNGGGMWRWWCMALGCATVSCILELVARELWWCHWKRRWCRKTQTRTCKAIAAKLETEVTQLWGPAEVGALMHLLYWILFAARLSFLYVYLGKSPTVFKRAYSQINRHWMACSSYACVLSRQFHWVQAIQFISK